MEDDSTEKAIYAETDGYMLEAARTEEIFHALEQDIVEHIWRSELLLDRVGNCFNKLHESAARVEEVFHALEQDITACKIVFLCRTGKQWPY